MRRFFPSRWLQEAASCAEREMKISGNVSKVLVTWPIIVVVAVNGSLAQQPPRLEPKKKTGGFKYGVPGGKRGESCSDNRAAYFRVEAVYAEHDFRTTKTTPQLFWYSSGP